MEEEKKCLDSNNSQLKREGAQDLGGKKAVKQR